MQIGTRQVDGMTVIDMVGRLDTSTSGDAYDEMVGIAKSGVTKVVLNLDKMEYVSSAGLRVILTAAKLLKSSKGEMKICHANGVVKEVLETSGFNHIIDIYDEEKDAIAALSS
jgi:anti-sigma B factor antagonist